jgi:hypothetical protein
MIDINITQLMLRPYKKTEYEELLNLIKSSDLEEEFMCMSVAEEQLYKYKKVTKNGIFNHIDFEDYFGYLSQKTNFYHLLLQTCKNEIFLLNFQDKIIGPKPYLMYFRCGFLSFIHDNNLDHIITKNNIIDHITYNFGRDKNKPLLECIRLLFKYKPHIYGLVIKDNLSEIKLDFYSKLELLAGLNTHLNRAYDEEVLSMVNTYFFEKANVNFEKNFSDALSFSLSIKKGLIEEIMKFIKLYHGADAVNKLLYHYLIHAKNFNPEFYLDVYNVFEGEGLDIYLKGIFNFEHSLAYLEEFKKLVSLCKLFMTPEVKQKLLTGLNEIKKEDQRDFILNEIQDLIYNGDNSFDVLMQSFDAAKAKGKIKAPKDPNFDIAKSPKLYWLNGTALEDDHKKFLLYRIQKSKGINSDIEARVLVRHIDKASSSDFGVYVLKYFMESNFDNKLKYYTLLGAMLGGDHATQILYDIYKNGEKEKRAKLSEMAMEAMALVGSDKALRILEGIGRKMANKKPKVSQLAHDALAAAAQEMGINIDDLSDRIVPHFDFDGLFKHFEIDGEPYRAYLNEDFVMCYLDESNKILKALPKNASKELKDEFADTIKEIKEVVKLQESKINNYLLENRRWSAEQWTSFYLNNPIMFNYAMKLLWASYDKEGKFLQSFRCLEDTSLLSFNDEEITLVEGSTIGLLHPILVDQNQITSWKHKLYEDNLVYNLVDQLDRKVYTPLPEELDTNIIKKYDGMKCIKDADTVKSYLLKKNYLGKAEDGGMMVFSKTYLKYNLVVRPSLDGVAVWYQGNNEEAVLGGIYFVNSNNENVNIKDVPPIIYSETMADIEGLVNQPM